MTKTWLLFAEISSQGGLSCSHWLIRLLGGEVMYMYVHYCHIFKFYHHQEYMYRIAGNFSLGCKFLNKLEITLRIEFPGHANAFYISVSKGSEI